MCKSANRLQETSNHKSLPQQIINETIKIQLSDIFKFENYSGEQIWTHENFFSLWQNLFRSAEEQQFASYTGIFETE